MTDIADQPPKDADEVLLSEVRIWKRRLTMLRQAIPSETWDEIARSHYHMTKWFNERREAI